MSQPFRIGIAGLGTVGVGVIQILQQNAQVLSKRCGRSIELVAVSSRSKDKDRGIDLSAYEWVDDACHLVGVHDVDMQELDAVIELIGGSDGVAYDLVKTALGNGVHVVTANKALMAHHGYELAKLAEENNVSLAYEAAVAGGIPIIKAMRESLTANKVSTVFGILNGTCNYILTQMRESGADFADVLKDAQDLGYAESDPAFDIGGIDAAHKITLLSSIAFGIKPDFENVHIRGIEEISSIDIDAAAEFGLRIKLLGVSRDINGKIVQSVEPCMVPIESPLGTIEDVYNAVFVETDFVETPLFTGLGAGRAATASAVVADIVDLARGIKASTFGVPVNNLLEASRIDLGETVNRYYIRLIVLDKPGVIADVTAILRDNNISIESFVQRGRDPDQEVSVVMVTHDAKRADIEGACMKMSALASVSANPCIIRIEDI